MEPAELPTAVQHSLQHLYRIEISQTIDKFVSSDRDIYMQLGEQGEIPDEILLLREQDGAMDLGLFLDEAMLKRATAALHMDQWSQNDVQDIASVIEGVSHLVCVLWHADQEREVRPLDLELQAEIDKYVLMQQVCRSDTARAQCLHMLFDVTGSEDDPLLAERYARARREAWIYCQWLQARFDCDNDLLQRELATFYRRSGPAKLRYISEVH